jgi:hypothetical protein
VLLAITVVATLKPDLPGLALHAFRHRRRNLAEIDGPVRGFQENVGAVWPVLGSIFRAAFWLDRSGSGLGSGNGREHVDLPGQVRHRIAAQLKRARSRIAGLLDRFTACCCLLVRLCLGLVRFLRLLRCYAFGFLLGEFVCGLSGKFKPWLRRRLIDWLTLSSATSRSIS